MKALLVTLVLFGSLSAHATLLLNCTEDPDPKWIKTTVQNWKSGIAQAGIVVKSMKQAQTRIKDVFDNGLGTLMGEKDIAKVILQPKVAKLVYAPKSHDPAVCVVFRGALLAK